MRILKHNKLNGWSVIEMTMPLIQSPLCPACEVPLLVIAFLKGIQQIRIGVCDTCGYMGYVDRPTKEWFDAFYEEKWDGEGQASAETLLNEFRHTQWKFRPKGTTFAMLASIQGAVQDKSKPVLDIGCGFGSAMREAQELGYMNPVGIEKSNHRADVARRAFSYDIRQGAFEDLNLSDKAPYSVIWSHHVLEHAYDPQVFIAKCASLQEAGGFLITSVPNNLGEPTMGVIHYLPHIHSFTVTCLRRLLGKQGYEVFDYSMTNKESLNLIAIKRPNKVGIIKTNGFAQRGAEKLDRKSTRLNSSHIQKSRMPSSA